MGTPLVLLLDLSIPTISPLIAPPIFPPLRLSLGKTFQVPVIRECRSRLRKPRQSLQPDRGATPQKLAMDLVKR